MPCRANWSSHASRKASIGARASGGRYAAAGKACHRRCPCGRDWRRCPVRRTSSTLRGEGVGRQATTRRANVENVGDQGGAQRNVEGVVHVVRVSALIPGAWGIRLPSTPLAVSTAGRGASSEAPAFWAVVDAHLRLCGRLQPLLPRAQMLFGRSSMRTYVYVDGFNQGPRAAGAAGGTTARSKGRRGNGLIWSPCSHGCSSPGIGY